MVTRDDVAQRAGTSTAVVSYVVNDGPRPVAPDTRARVLAAVAELGYRPNAIARSLRAARTDTVGVLLEDHRPASTRLLAGAESVATDFDVGLLVGTRAGQDPLAAKHVRAFVDRQADGLLLATRVQSAGVVGELARSKRPRVEVFATDPTDLDETFVDDTAAIRSAANHLRRHGAGRVVHVVEDELPGAWGTAVADRLQVDAVVRRVDVSPYALTSSHTRPLGVVAASVATALAIAPAVRDERLLLIATADDVEDAIATSLGISVVAHPWREIGALAMQTLLDLVSGDSPDGRATGPTVPTLEPVLRCVAGCVAPVLAPSLRETPV